jgi:hypothetical protein
MLKALFVVFSFMFGFGAMSASAQELIAKKPASHLGQPEIGAAQPADVVDAQFEEVLHQQPKAGPGPMLFPGCVLMEDASQEGQRVIMIMNNPSPQTLTAIVRVTFHNGDIKRLEPRIQYPGQTGLGFFAFIPTFSDPIGETKVEVLITDDLGRREVVSLRTNGLTGGALTYQLIHQTTQSGPDMRTFTFFFRRPIQGPVSVTIGYDSFPASAVRVDGQNVVIVVPQTIFFPYGNAVVTVRVGNECYSRLLTALPFVTPPPPPIAVPK